MQEKIYKSIDEMPLYNWQKCMEGDLRYVREDLKDLNTNKDDFAIVYDKKISWNVKADVDNDQIPDYLECVLVGEALGLYSGRHFKNRKGQPIPDWPHLQIGK